MLNKSNINLTKLMEQLVDKYVEHYKTDFNYDKESMLDKEFNTDTFYWILRNCGTNLLSSQRIFATGDYTNFEATYYGNQDVKIYKIIIKKRGKKYAYGDVQELKNDKFLAMVTENSKPPQAVKMTIIFKDNTGKAVRNEVEIQYNKRQKLNEELYYIQEELRINKAQITRMYIQEYKFTV